jgi:hypothetical protein
MDSELQGFRRLAAAIVKVQQRGMSWAIRRAQAEIQLPTSAPSRIARNVSAMIERAYLRGTATFAYVLPNRGALSRDTLYVFVDLEVVPITFDVVTGLGTAELYRRRHGFKDLHIVVVPGKDEGLKEEAVDYAVILGKDALRWRIHNLLIPIFRLLPSCKGYTVCGSRREAYLTWFARTKNIFPTEYSVSFPMTFEKRDASDAARAGECVLPMFRATPKALEYMRRFLKPRAAGRRVVVLNLRSYAFMPGRNSNDANWYEFARELDKNQWLPVFVLDTDLALDPKPAELEEFVVCDAVPFNIELRMALYELADLTMAVTQGPLELCWFNDRATYVSFVKPGSSIHTTDDHYRERGYDIGKGPPFMAANHRWVWEHDELSIIQSVFTQMTTGMPSRPKHLALET